MDEDLPEASGQHVSGVFGGSVTDVGHLVLALEPPPDPVVNTLGLPPAPLELVIAVALVPNEHLRALFHDLGTGGGSDGHGCCKSKLKLEKTLPNRTDREVVNAIQGSNSSIVKMPTKGNTLRDMMETFPTFKISSKKRIIKIYSDFRSTNFHSYLSVSASAGKGTIEEKQQQLTGR